MNATKTGNPFGVPAELSSRIRAINSELDRMPFSGLSTPENHALLLERDRLSAIAEEIEANHEPTRVWDAFVALLCAAQTAKSYTMLEMDSQRLDEAIETAKEILGR